MVEIAKVFIPAAIAKSALLFASKDKPHMRGVYVKGRWAYATCGHTGIAIECATEFAATGLLDSAKLSESMTKTGALVEVDQDLKFPHIARVIPNTKPHEGSPGPVCFDPQYLERVMKAAKLLKCNEIMAVPQLSLEAPQLFRFGFTNADLALNAYAVVMPLRGSCEYPWPFEIQSTED